MGTRGSHPGGTVAMIRVAVKGIHLKSLRLQILGARRLLKACDCNLQRIREGSSSWPLAE